MTWEAHRWTAKTPTELYHTLGPHGVDDLVRQMIAACWRHLPADGRSLAAGVAAARAVYDRNVAVWRRIRKPGPESFFADLGATEADHFCRQAMVVTWMMMPRTGGREVADALRIFGRIFDRNLEAWEADDATFTGKPRRRAAVAERRGAVKRAKATDAAKPGGGRTKRAGAKPKAGTIKRR